MYRVLTELTVIAHLLFILFVVAGGFIARRRRWSSIVHLSAVAWAIYAEAASGVICPLTTLENHFAQRAGLSTYQEDFVTRYLVPVIYQDEVALPFQYALVVIVLVINVVAYATQRRRTA